MEHYEIQRYNPKTAKPCAGGWVPAYGLKKRSWPKAGNDQDAIAAFRVDTARARTAMRLVKWGGFGYGGSRITVVATNGIEELAV